MAPRTRKTKNKPNEQTQELLEAVTFVASAQHKEGTLYQTHCRIMHGAIMAADGVLAAGAPIAADLHICPHTHRLRDALARCEGPLSLTVETSSVRLKAGKFAATVPLVDGRDVFRVDPDPPRGSLTDDLRFALDTAGIVAVEGAQTLVMASVLMRSGSCVGTNGHVIIEAWHGLDLPTLCVPKAFVDRLAKHKSPLVQYGSTDASFTVWFEDGKWLKTQLYQDPWPDTDRVLNVSLRLRDIDPAFYPAVDKIEDFVDDAFIYFRDNKVWSSEHDSKGASYELHGIECCPINPKHLQSIRAIAKQFDTTTFRDRLFFVGDKVRGAISGKAV